MFSIFSSKEVPEWANFFSTKEYKKFIEIVDNYFRSKNYKVTINEGIANVSTDDFGINKFGLTNLAQTCKLEDNSDWSAIIDYHFEGMRKAYEFDKVFEVQKDDFEYAKQFIGVRLYHKSYFDPIGIENAVFRNVTEDIIEVLIYDFPHTVSNIKPDQAKVWDKALNELFSIGSNRVKENYPLEISQEPFNDFKLWFAQGNHLFGTNIILDKESLQKYTGSNGSLIGIPHRHAVLIYPIETLEVVKAINTLIPVISGMHNEGPGSISEKLYWYTNGNFIDLPYFIVDKKLQFRPPNEFVEMIQTLSK